MEAMKEFPDNFFELAIVDPPYGIDKDYFEAAKKRIDLEKSKLTLF